MLAETNWSDTLSSISSGKETMYNLFGIEYAKPVA